MTTATVDAVTVTVAHLARFNSAVWAWDEHEANGLPPADGRRPLERPRLTRGGLWRLQLMLVEQIGELEMSSLRG